MDESAIVGWNNRLDDPLLTPFKALAGDQAPIGDTVRRGLDPVRGCEDIHNFSVEQHIHSALQQQDIIGKNLKAQGQFIEPGGQRVEADIVAAGVDERRERSENLLRGLLNRLHHWLLQQYRWR